MSQEKKYTVELNKTEMEILIDSMDYYINKVGTKSSSLVYSVLTDLWTKLRVNFGESQ